MNKHDHFFKDSPKYILSLDGGGVRGVLSLAYLERIEAILRDCSDNPSTFRLSDHFSLIGGTSTGSIIASALALGHTVSDILDVYVGLASNTFGKKNLLGGIVTPKFAEGPLIESIRSRVGDVTLGGDEIKTGLGIIAKRLDTNSVWLFHNHPNGPYFENTSSDVTFTANKDIKLLNIVRASTAAPTYFDPEFISIAPGVEGTFVDGGVSPHNNPTLALFMLATIRGYGFRWPMGPEVLHFVSIGTGQVIPQSAGVILRRTAAAAVGISAIKSMMSDCESLVETMMQWMSICHTPNSIDSEIGDLHTDLMGNMPTCHYARYNVQLDVEWLGEQLGHSIKQKDVTRLTKMDDPRVIPDLIAIGRVAAERQIIPEALLLP